MRISACALVACIMVALMTSACAQDVADIDRTQTNRLKKSDLAGDWFVAQTITEAPPTTVFTFTGETSVTERIRWEIREDVLIAYRAYARLEGSDPDAKREGKGYTENPIAAFPILSHFDVQRQYNTSTGEESNIIVENSSDRLWFERDYIRVDWSRNLISNFEFISTAATITNLSYFVQEEEVGDPDAMVREVDEAGRLKYFDFVNKIQVLPDEWGCFFTIYGWSAEDCTAAELKVRMSFLRAEELREYEPVQYDDRMMAKFGYFRTERFGFDPWRGVTQTGRSLLANRHSIWEQVWRRDDKGEVVRDGEGRLQALPMKERVAKPIVYYTSLNMPADVVETSKIAGQSWDNAFRQAVAAAQGKSAAQVPQMFVVCHNPVTADDPEVCGEEGKVVRMGDIRYNHMVWVDRYTQAGLLGYGPSGADPLTGEIIFGSAYVYGTAVDTYAQYAADLVNLINDNLSEEDLRTPEYVREEVKARLKGDVSRPKARSAALGRMRPGKDRGKLMGAKRAQKMAQVKRVGLEPAATDRDAQVRKKMRDSGFDALMINDELARGLSYGRAASASALTPALRQALAPSGWATPAMMKQRTKRRWMEASRHNMYLKEFADDSIFGLAQAYKDLDPEDEAGQQALRLAMRAAVYRAVMEHEIGHTLGLRHNFQGSYDALNYFDEYWVLRKENLIKDVQSLDDEYKMAERTPAQQVGRMQEYAYSSIMDYGMRFNSDIQGIGRYDIAAIVFGYTTGTHDVRVGPEAGYVEVWEAPGRASSYLRQYEDPASLAYPVLLENYHYTTVAQAFGSLDDLKRRTRMLWRDVKEARAANPGSSPIEVHYMFCSDEWVDALVSCQLFDAGADPFEQARHTIENYRNYYALTHYHRDRAFFFSEDVLNSIYGRYFTALTVLYQQFVFAYFYETDDVLLDDYYMFGAFAAFNLLNEVLMTPPVGAFAKNGDGVWQITSYEPVPGAALNINHGDGRPSSSTFQYDTGYYFYDRVEEVGHFWDVLAAMFALTDSEAYRLGVDVDADFRSFSIPWYLFFEKELTQSFNGIYNKNAKKFGPRLVNGQVQKRPLALLAATGANGEDVLFDPETGVEWPVETEGEPIDIDYGFTEQLYAGLYGMAFFTANFSLNYPDQLRVFRLGTGEESTPSAGFEVVRFDDPLTGISYGALSKIGATEEEETGGVELIRQGQRAAAAYNGAADEDARLDAFYAVQEVSERINLVRSMYSIFSVVF
jgi:hypothetical protein